MITQLQANLYKQQLPHEYQYLFKWSSSYDDYEDYLTDEDYLYMQEELLDLIEYNRL